MRYFVVESVKTSKNIGIVFHDPLTTHYIIKTSSESFRNSFEDSSTFLRSKLVKSDGKMYIRSIGAYDYDWALLVLKKACSDTWKVTDTGEVNNDHELINELTLKYLV